MCDEMSNPVFAGRACFGDLGGDIRVRIDFVELTHHDHYDALKATVLNRTGGEVDVLSFRFSDILGKRTVTHPNGVSEEIIPKIVKNKPDDMWAYYKPTNADYKQIAEAVNAYVSVFKDKSLMREKVRPAEKESVIKQIRDSIRKPVSRKAPAKKRGLEL